MASDSVKKLIKLEVSPNEQERIRLAAVIGGYKNMSNMAKAVLLERVEAILKAANIEPKI